MNKLAKRGFTVVELAIVIVVVGLLATLILITFGKVQAEARDTKRKNDIQLFVNAMDKYYEANGAYPTGCSNRTAALSSGCVVANGALTGGAGIYQDTTISGLRAILPGISADFGGPRSSPNLPFSNSGAPSLVFTRYVFWGQLDGTAVASNSSIVFGGPSSPAGIDCGLASSTIAVTMLAGPLPKATSFFVAYYNESDNQWFIYQGKYGSGLTVPPSGNSLKGTTIGKCVFAS